MSKDARHPSVWGEKFWFVYDVIAETYPLQPNENEKRALKRFFYSQQHLLPCKRCRKNYRSILRVHPPRVESRDAFQSWLKLLKKEVKKHKETAAALEKR